LESSCVKFPCKLCPTAWGKPDRADSIHTRKKTSETSLIYSVISFFQGTPYEVKKERKEEKQKGDHLFSKQQQQVHL
jgi:hypothetical protein